MATLQEVTEEINYQMGKLEKFFTKDCRLTFIMRHVSKPGCYMVLSKDDLQKVVETVLKEIEKATKEDSD